jgi:hypothetical protein
VTYGVIWFMHRVIRNPENWIVAVVGLFAVVFFGNSFSYRPSAALFPRLVSAVVGSLCFYQLGSGIRRSLRTGLQEPEPAGATVPGLAWYWSFLLTAGYIALIALIGFIAGTGIFLILFPILAGYRRWVRVALFAVALVIMAHIGFGMFLHVQFPSGLLF